MLELGLLLVGIIGLWIGTKLTVDKAVEIAKTFNFSQTFIGLTILAFGTDLPETIISVNSSIHRYQGMETSGIVLGNAIGSSICQISLIVGLSGLFVAHTIERKMMYRDGGVMVVSILALFLVGHDGIISRWESLLLVLAFVAYYYFLTQDEVAAFHGKQLQIPKIHEKTKTIKLSVLLLAGLVIIIFSSELAVQSAVKLAEIWGIKQSFVGIIIIGLGTSLPELSVSIGAALKKSSGIAVGNIMGSNIYDTLIPAGVGGLISPLQVGETLYDQDLPILFVITLIVLVLFSSKKGLQRKESIGLIFIYLAYTYWKWSSFASL